MITELGVDVSGSIMISIFMLFGHHHYREKVPELSPVTDNDKKALYDPENMTKLTDIVSVVTIAIPVM